MHTYKLKESNLKKKQYFLMIGFWKNISSLYTLLRKTERILYQNFFEKIIVPVGVLFV